MSAMDSMGGFHAHRGQCGRSPHPPWKALEASTPTGMEGILACIGQRKRLPCLPWTAWEASMPTVDTI